MILSNQGIKRALDAGDLIIDPLPEADQYTTSAVDFFVGSDFRCWDEKIFKVSGATVTLNLAEQKFQMTAAAYLRKMELEKDGTFLFPPYAKTGTHVLGITRELVHLKMGSKLAARVEGRSSLARIGLVVHLTAPTIHAGFKGNITLEIINHSPFWLKLEPNKTRLCQIIFEQLESDPSSEIKTDFQGQTSPSGR